MVGWHHRLSGHDFEQDPGESEGQESLVCCIPWGCKESDTTERLDNNSNGFLGRVGPKTLLKKARALSSGQPLPPTLDQTTSCCPSTSHPLALFIKVLL